MKTDNDSAERLRVPTWYWLLIPAVMLLFQSWFTTVGVAQLPYSEFKQLLYAGKVSDAAVAEQIISGTLKPSGLEQVLSKETLDRIKCVQDRPCRFSTARVADPSLVQDMEAYGVRMARHMVTQYGMSEQLGLATFEAAPGALVYPPAAPQRQEYSERTARAIDAEIARLLDEAHVRVRDTLAAKRGLLDALAQALLARETVDRAALDALVKAADAARPLLPVQVKSGT